MKPVHGFLFANEAEARAYAELYAPPLPVEIALGDKGVLWSVGLPPGKPEHSYPVGATPLPC